MSSASSVHSFSFKPEEYPALEAWLNELKGQGRGVKAQVITAVLAAHVGNGTPEPITEGQQLTALQAQLDRIEKMLTEGAFMPAAQEGQAPATLATDTVLPDDVLANLDALAL